MDALISTIFGRIAMIAGLVGLMGLIYFFSKIPDQRAAADHLEESARRSQDWLLETFAQRVAATAGGLQEYVPSTDQSLDRTANLVFPATFRATNVWGQTVAVKVLQPNPGASPATLYAMVTTCGGDTPSPTDLAKAASLVADGGFISDVNPGQIMGGGGFWVPQPTATYTTGTCPVVPGHLAKFIVIDNGKVTPPFIHRYSVGADPEPNTMHTTLFMGNQTIENAQDVRLQNGKWLSSAIMDATIVQHGASIQKPNCPHGSPAIYVGTAGFSDEGPPTTPGSPLVSVQAYAVDAGASWTVQMVVDTVSADGTTSRRVPAGAYSRAIVLTKCQ